MTHLLLMALMLATPAPGDGGVSDSLVSVRFSHGMNQSNNLTASYSSDNGDLLYSRCYYFDMAVDSLDSAYTRGTLGDTLSLYVEDFVGQWMHVLAYKSAATDTVEITVEQSVFYDSTAFDTGTGWNYGYQYIDTLFGGELISSTAGGVDVDSFFVNYPIVRLKFRNLKAAASGAMLFALYTHRPDHQYAAPQGRYTRINPSAIRELRRIFDKY